VYAFSTVINPEDPGKAELIPLPIFSVYADGKPVASSKMKGKKALVSAHLLNTNYSIHEDAALEQNMQVLGLVEEIINLQKSSADRPATLPVHVLP
jgi:hypothetical protein